jgi:deaminated glutathione amidase
MTEPRTLVASAIQITAVDGEKEAAVEKMMAFLDEAGRRGSDLCVLPELWTGLGFSDHAIYREIAEPLPGPLTARLGEKARAYGMYIAGSMYEAAPDGRYHNSLPLIGPDGAIVGIYRKTHLFDAPNRTDIPPGIVESRKVAPGDALEVYGTNLARMGLSVCSDLRFPEVYREMALKGAEILVCASAFLAPRYDHWEFFLRARAAENQAWVIASGQYGREPKTGLGFVGRSMIVDPWGVVVATASDEEGVVTATIDLGLVGRVRARYPLLDQRRPELYGTIGTRGTCQ